MKVISFSLINQSRTLILSKASNKFTVLCILCTRVDYVCVIEMGLLELIVKMPTGDLSEVSVVYR